jgi:hypothetical protein
LLLHAAKKAETSSARFCPLLTKRGEREMLWKTKEQMRELYKEREEALFFDYQPIRAKKIKPPKARKSQDKEQSGGRARRDISNFARRLNQNPAKEPRKSCARFEKTKQGAREHNFREYKPEHEPDYLLPKEFRKENYKWELTDKETGAPIKPKALFEKELAKYGKGKGKRPRYENSNWELVLVLNETHGENDIFKIKDYLERKLNITCYQFAIHRDEGHLDENKQPVYNYHAHLNFITIKDRQQNFRLTKTKHLMPSIQTEIAKLLNMPRGEMKSPRNHLRPQEYKQLMKLKRLVYKLIQKRKTLRTNERDNKAEIQRLTQALQRVNSEIATLQQKPQNTDELNKLKAENAKISTLYAELKEKNDQVERKNRILEREKENFIGNYSQALKHTSEYERIQNLYESGQLTPTKENQRLQAELDTANAQITALKEKQTDAPEAQQSKAAEPKIAAAVEIPPQNENNAPKIENNVKTQEIPQEIKKVENSREKTEIEVLIDKQNADMLFVEKNALNADAKDKKFKEIQARQLKIREMRDEIVPNVQDNSYELISKANFCENKFKEFDKKHNKEYQQGR